MTVKELVQAVCEDCGDILLGKRTKRCAACHIRMMTHNPQRRANLVARNNSQNRHRLYAEKSMVLQKYVVEKKSLREVSVELKCSLRTVVRWLRIHDIPTRECKEAKLMARRIGEHNPRWTGCRKCPKCGGKKAWGTLTCIKCRDTRGEKNCNYKGIAKIMTLAREWSATHWRPQIFKRDRYACTKCGDVTGGNLQAHHIVPLNQIVRKLKKERGINKDSTSSERLEFLKYLISHPEMTSLSNGSTLCKHCHRIEHKFTSWNSNGYRAIPLPLSS